MSHVPYTALPLATLTLTAHTRPVSRRAGTAARDEIRAEGDGARHDEQGAR